MLSESESGNIYVRGLFVCNNDKLKYGYDLSPYAIKLDRDRRLVDTLNLFREVSLLWKEAVANSDDSLKDKFLELCNKEEDAEYIKDISMYINPVVDLVAKSFYEEHRSDAIPVTDSSEYEIVKKNGEGNPLIISTEDKQLLGYSTLESIKEVDKQITVQNKLRNWISKIIDKYGISNEELDEFNKIVDEI